MAVCRIVGRACETPWHLYRGRFEELGVVVRSGNYTLYGDMSARVMRILADFTPDLEVYSIDEAFLSPVSQILTLERLPS